MSYYEQVANMLGLELGEKFKLRNDESNYCDDTFYFSEDGLKDFDSVYNCNGILDEILREKPEIVKLPWKPKVGEQYSYCLSQGHAVVSSTWRCATTDLCYWKAGNCFKTEEEARIKGKEILEQIKKEFEEA